jgi:hypothetical protein
MSSGNDLDSEMLNWIFTHNVTVLERVGGGFACLYQMGNGRAMWGPSAKSKRDAVMAAMRLRPEVVEPQSKGAIYG